MKNVPKEILIDTKTDSFISSPKSLLFSPSLSCKTFQLGIALGFVLPPKLVRNHDDLDMIGDDLRLMFYIIAGFTSVLVVLVVLCEYICSFS